MTAPLPLLALQQTDPFSLVGRLLESPYTKATLALFALASAALYLSLVWWTYSDASRRGALRLPWTLAALLFPFLGTLVYLLCRPPEYVLDARERELEMLALELVLAEGTKRCPRCEAPARADYLGCPRCGQALREECGGCGRALEEEWTVCPYCMTSRTKGRRARGAGEGPAPGANGRAPRSRAGGGGGTPRGSAGG